MREPLHFQQATCHMLQGPHFPTPITTQCYRDESQSVRAKQHCPVAASRTPPSRTAAPGLLLLPLLLSPFCGSIAAEMPGVHAAPLHHGDKGWSNSELEIVVWVLSVSWSHNTRPKWPTSTLVLQERKTSNC